MRLTTVSGTFSADHQRPYGDRRHGHDWHVEAAMPESGDKEAPQAKLDAALDRWDHTFLDEQIEDPSNEGLAEWLGVNLGCAWVKVWRFDRGRKFGAEWYP